MLSMIFLSDAERAQLIAQHRRERDKRIYDRIKAVTEYLQISKKNCIFYPRITPISIPSNDYGSG